MKTQDYNNDVHMSQKTKLAVVKIAHYCSPKTHTPSDEFFTLSQILNFSTHFEHLHFA